MKINRSVGLMCLVIILSWGMWGCAGPSIYTVNMGYRADYTATPSYLKPDAKALQSIITVAEFSDVRKVDDPLVIGRVIEKDGMKVLILPKNARPTQAAAQGVREYLRKAGYNISGITNPWNLQESSIPQSANSKLLIGGAIEEMDVNCRRAFPTNAYTTKIRLTLYLADITTRKIQYRATVEATTSLEHALFSEERLGGSGQYCPGGCHRESFRKERTDTKNQRNGRAVTCLRLLRGRLRRYPFGKICFASEHQGGGLYEDS